MNIKTDGQTNRIHKNFVTMLQCYKRQIMFANHPQIYHLCPEIPNPIFEKKFQELRYSDLYNTATHYFQLVIINIIYANDYSLLY